MSKIRDKDIAAEYDFSRGERGVHFDRAKNGIKTIRVSDAQDRARTGADPHAAKPPTELRKIVTR